VIGAPGNAEAATGGAGSGLTDLSYVLTLRSGGLEPYVYIPREVPTDVGHSYVQLLHDFRGEHGYCEARGAGYWLDTVIEEGVLGAGLAPPDAGDISGGYHNPTVTRDVKPDVAAPGTEGSKLKPGVKNYFPPGQTVVPLSNDGPGYIWQAACDDEYTGHAQGDAVNTAGFQAVGSISQAAVDKRTGIYTGTSRAYVLGMAGASGFDSASSLMQVTQQSGKEARITYRMSYFNSGDSTESGITFGGQDIPLSQFADQFNSQAKTLGQAGSAVGPNGVGTLTPEVGVTSEGGRYSITISAGHGNFGLTSRDGTVGGNQGMRVGAVTFSGAF
jgi:hypothetical protein